ncbi:MAG: twin-arginine translocase subunit TatC [Elusimicrobia bacterium]|nr:twin-arginine translocase subunit TatC [Elusimicrobiota bacterium]
MPYLVERPGAEPEVILDKPRPLLEHLEELRERLIAALAGWFAATVVAYAAYPKFFPYLVRPPVTQLVFTSPVEPFFVQCKVALVGGILLSFPWLLYQAWRFVALGLRAEERRWLLRLIPAAYALFLTGGAIGLFGVGPMGLRFLLSYSTPQLVPYITLSSYLGFLSYLTLGLAILFQLPVALFVLATLGMLRLSTLTQHRRHAFVGILIAAALITPSPDVFGQLLVALPTYLLYELSILFVWLSGRR